MSRMSEEEVRDEVESELPDRKIHWVVFYEGYWYVLAIGADPEEGGMNPYFRVNDSTGSLAEFYIVQDFDLFERVLEEVGRTHG